MKENRRMEFFDKYTSNTLAGSGNQSFFVTEDEKRIFKSRTCYRVFCGGEFDYSFLFSNIIDSTFADGSFSRKNMIVGTWKIHEMNVGITDDCDETSMNEPGVWKEVTFGGKREKEVAPGEIFNTDSVRLAPKAGEYICLEISFSGHAVPYHPESLIPSFVSDDGKWTPSQLHPFASMVGAHRPVKKRIAFWGDSITQGIGTETNSYTHWNSVAAENLGTDYAYWNLGLGFGRADDAASCGAWFFKAKQNDIAAVCFGVNDILRKYNADRIKENLNKIVDELLACNVKVIMQTIPPFDYEGEEIDVWNDVNDYIKNELSQKTEFVFDCAALLRKSEEEPHMALYGGHPDDRGCKIWGDRLSEALAEYLM